MSDCEVKIQSGDESTAPEATAATTMEGSSSAATSHAELPASLRLKFKTQVDRMAALQELKDSLPKCAPNITLEEAKVYSAQVDEIHHAFLQDHSFFESTWPEALIDHEYFNSKMFLKESQHVLKLKLRLSRIMEELEIYQRPPRDNSPKQPPSRSSITVPSFTGDYLQWPKFKAEFSTLIIENQQLTAEERQQFLIKSLSEAPAHFLKRDAISTSSFKSAWESLTARYENKRLIVNAQLDRLLTISQVTSTTPAALRKLITSANEINSVITALGHSDPMWNCLLVHHVVRSLSKSMREAWEISLGSSHDFPRFQRLESFIGAQARALESAVSKALSTSSTPAASSKDFTAVEKSQTQQSTHCSSVSTDSYLCDCCNGDHFVVMCPAFRKLPVSQRRELITSHALCRNCCGRHATVNCKSALRCKICGSQHHTMLHLIKPPAQATTQRKG